MHASSGAGVSAMSRHLGQLPSDAMYNGTTGYPNGKSQTLGSTASRKRRERPRPVGSLMLTDIENQHLFDMLGPERISLTAGVAQLLAAENNGISSRWTKWHVGIASLIKDYSQKCYSIGIFDVFNGEPLWSQVLYREFRATSYPNCPRFITFEGDQHVFGLNFSDHAEAEEFREHLKKRSEQEQKSYQRDQRVNVGSGYHQQQSTAQPRPTSQNKSTISTSAPVRPPQSQLGGGITTMGTAPHFSPSSMAIQSGKGSGQSKALKDRKESKKSKKGKERTRIRKDQIGQPTDFKHLAHVGWNQESGFSGKVSEEQPMDNTVKDLLRAAGHDPEKFSSNDIKFVYEFLEEQGLDRQTLTNGSTTFPVFGNQHQTSNSLAAHHNMQQQRSTMDLPAHQQPPPLRRDISAPQPMSTSIAQHKQPPPRPPPMSNGPASHGRPLPQPPPHVSGHQQQKPTVNAHQNGSRQLPPPPPQPESNGLGRPPPPPIPQSAPVTHNGIQAPAPVASNVPPPPPPPPPQLMSGSAGAPKPPPPPPMPGTGAPKPAPADDSRTNLLQQIQQGAKLKRVEGPTTMASGKQPVATNPPNTRDHMLQQIQQGAQLKHVDPTETENRKSASQIQDLGGIAGALARALEERRKNMVNSEEESAEDNDSEWEDD
ncbi:WH1 domain-containing protein [Ditylenchus destructor]|nr:WH1 domain-containing protein [Ditylenchus destructor]